MITYDENKLNFITSDTEFYKQVILKIMNEFNLTLEESIDKAYDLKLFPIKTPNEFRNSKFSSMSDREARYFSYQKKFFDLCVNPKMDLKRLDREYISSFVEIYVENINKSYLSIIRKRKIYW